MTQISSRDIHVSIPLGVFIGLLASFIQSLGLTIQRKSHVLDAQLPESQRSVEHRRPLWLLGFVIFFFSNILGSLVQIASLPVVILAPLGAVSLLWNAFFARFLLGDVFSLWLILGTLLIAGGAVLIALFGIVPEPTRSLEDLLELFARPAFVAYFSLLGAVVVVCLATIHIVEFSFQRRLAALSPVSTPPLSPASTTRSTALPAGVIDTVPMEHTPLLDRKVPSSSPPSQRSPSPSPKRLETELSIPAIHRTRLLLAISYSSFSGILSGMCLLFAKSGVELLVLTLKGQNQFWRWQAWMLVLGLVVFALLQLWYLHRALVLADPSLVCPSAFCFYNLSSIVNGLVYFNQFSLIPPLHLSLVGLGMVILLGGVWVVSIQSGGGGVDVGTWHKVDGDESIVSEEPDDLEIGDVLQEGSISDNHPLAMGLEGHLSRPAKRVSSPSTLFKSDRVPRPPTVSIPSGVGAITPPSLRSPRSPQHEQQLTDSIVLSPSSTMTRHRRLQTISHHSSSPPPTLGIPGGGFQIGLSPLSPGFSLVPSQRHRRRVTSGFGLGLPGASTEGEDGGRRSMRRRTVSEGDLRRTSDDEGEGEEAGREETGDQVFALVGGGRSGKRWRWLKKLFVGAK